MNIEFFKDKNIVTFDVETTGNSFEESGICQISISLEKNGEILETFNSYVDPENDILQFDNGMEIHNIPWDVIKQAPPFSVLSDKVLELLNKADIIIGYKVSFDLKFIQKSLLDNNVQPNQFKFLRAIVLDPYSFWLKKEPRKLKNAIKYFLGIENIENLHDSETDILYTRKLIEPMLEKLDSSIDEFIELTNEKPVGSSGILILNNKNIIEFSFGKHKGLTLDEVKSLDPKYLEWILSSNFDNLTKNIIKNKLK